MLSLAIPRIQHTYRDTHYFTQHQQQQKTFHSVNSIEQIDFFSLFFHLILYKSTVINERQTLYTHTQYTSKQLKNIIYT